MAQPWYFSVNRNYSCNYLQLQLQLQLQSIGVVSQTGQVPGVVVGGARFVGSGLLDPWVVVSGSLDFLVVGLGSGSKQQSSLASKFNPAGQLSIPHLSPSMQSLSPSQSPWST